MGKIITVNLDIDSDVWKLAKSQAAEESLHTDNTIFVKDWVAAAIITAANIDTVAKEYCRSLGWQEPGKEKPNVEPSA